jgi:hypothetical protein
MVGWYKSRPVSVAKQQLDSRQNSVELQVKRLQYYVVTKEVHLRKSKTGQE